MVGVSYNDKNHLLAMNHFSVLKSIGRHNLTSVRTKHMICIKSAFYLIVLKQGNQYLYMYVFTEKNTMYFIMEYL